MKNKITRNSAKVKKKIPAVQEEFSGKNMTAFGGTGLIRRFFEKIELEKILSAIEIDNRRESKYSPATMFLSIIFSMVLGKFRPEHMKIFAYDKVFQRLAGLFAFPVPSTITRFLKKLRVSAAAKVAQVNIDLLNKIREGFKDMAMISLDLDSHVSTVYGKQQRAALGYNPKKPGRQSYHPLLCFIGETRDFLCGKFRSGDQHTSNGAVKFLRETLQLLPDHFKKLRVRADSGFFSTEFLKFLEGKSLEYFIAVPLQPWVQRLMRGHRFRKHNRHIDVCDFYFCLGGVLTVRFVAIRMRLKKGERPKRDLPLFGGREAKYDYQVIATNSLMAQIDVWRTYNGRACCENFIKEGIYSFGLDRIVSHEWAGNSTWFQLVMLSYNLMNWFKEQVCEHWKKCKPMWSTLRERLILIPGRVVLRAGRLILKLPEEWPFQDDFERARVCLC